MIVRLDRLTAVYGSRHAVDGVSLELPDRAFAGLVGPNGSGKSTLLRMLYRALAPHQGRALLGEQDLWLMPHRAVARSVGVLAQDHGDGLDFTAREAVELGRHPHLGLFDRLTTTDLAAQYCDHLVVLDHGRLVAQGPPRAVLDTRLLHSVFHVDGAVVEDPADGRLRVLLRPIANVPVEDHRRRTS